MIGNIICQIPNNLHQQIQQAYPNAPNTLVGFENHSGETILSSNQSALAEVKYGYGNNYTSKQEGLVFHNAIGTYMHGSLLPKNPHLADFIIAKALQHRYQDQISLLALDDILAWQAHTYVLNRFGNS
jgi:CobQ-like glutamine amidotransferase family enzyme